VLADDASAAYSREQHQAALMNISIGFGVVTKVDEILDAWTQYAGNK
jgi:isochorismate hydrolase